MIEPNGYIYLIAGSMIYTSFMLCKTSPQYLILKFSGILIGIILNIYGFLKVLFNF